MIQKLCMDIAGTPRPGMSDAVFAGPFIFVAGQVSTDGDGRIVGSGDAKIQADHCFDKLDNILRKAGASLTDVVELTCYLDHPRYAAEYLAVRGARFPTNAPATTTVAAQLLKSGLLVEIRAVALVPTAAG